MESKLAVASARTQNAAFEKLLGQKCELGVAERRARRAGFVAVQYTSA
jgi:hypothetical protein